MCRKMRKGTNTMEKSYYGTQGTAASAPYAASAAPAMGYQGQGFSASPSAYAFAGQGGPTQFCPPNFAPTQVGPAQVSPTANTVNTNVMKHIVPHIHPSHTTVVNEHVFEHQHYFPHTTSVVNKCCSRHVFCGSPMGFGGHHHGRPCC